MNKCIFSLSLSRVCVGFFVFLITKMKKVSPVLTNISQIKKQKKMTPS